jgi:hypothetical protein
MDTNRESSDNEDKEGIAKNQYKQKVEEILARIRIHNQSLTLIVDAAL